MKGSLVFFMLIWLLPVIPVIPVYADQVDVGVSIGEEGIRRFYVSVGDYYHVPEPEVIVIRQRGIPYEEIPVVFFLASRAHVTPEAMIDLRLSGMSWMDITLHFGLGPEIFYVPVQAEIHGPPYGKAYGYYKHKPKKEWKTIRLENDDVVNLVNLRFISEYHGCDPMDVIGVRSQGREFIVINDDFKAGRHEKAGKHEDHGKEHGKNKGKDKGHKDE